MKRIVYHYCMRKLFFYFILLLLLFSLSSCKNETITIVHTSDLHYLSPSLIGNEEFLLRTMENGDGKNILHSSLITDSFIADMISLKPNFIVLSGDLTLNGEIESNEELKEKLKKLKDEGITILVISGNHDVNQKAYRYTDSSVEEIKSLTSQEFENFWWEYGYGDAIACDDWSNSYIYEASPKLWLLCIDSNTGIKGTIRGVTLSWIEEKLKEANDKGIEVISFTHQNLFVHNPNYTWGYQLDNANKLIELYKKYNVKLNLSGHLHIQSIKEEDNITDIAVSSLINAPNQYGILKVNGNKLSYKTKEISDKELKEESKLIFDKATRNKAENSFEEEKAIEGAITINREYFEGFINTSLDISTLFSSNEFFSEYIKTIYKEKGKDNRRWRNY